MRRITDDSNREPRKGKAHEVTVKTLTRTKSGWKVNYEKTLQINERD